MTHDRSYRPARPTMEAISEIVRLAGRQFDPSLVPLLAEQITNGGTPRPTDTPSGPPLPRRLGERAAVLVDRTPGR